MAQTHWITTAAGLMIAATAAKPGNRPHRIAVAVDDGAWQQGERVEIGGVACTITQVKEGKGTGHRLTLEAPEGVDLTPLTDPAFSSAADDEQTTQPPPGG